MAGGTPKIESPAITKEGKIDMRKSKHDWKRGHQKLSTEQVAEMIQRYQIGAVQKELADAYSVTVQTVRKHLQRAKVLRPSNHYRDKQDFRADPKKKVKAFHKEAASILWRVDGPGKERYESWRALITELIERTECSWEDAVVQASRETKCLKNLIKQYKLWEFTLLHATKVELEQIGKDKAYEEARKIALEESVSRNQELQEKCYPTEPGPQPMDSSTGVPTEIPISTLPATTPTALSVSAKILCLHIEQTFQENLAWAIQAAGLLLRTGTKPTECPNDSAFFLYQQACENPKDFLGRFAQVQGRLGGEKDDENQKVGKRAISEIEEQLQALDEVEKTDYKQEFIESELTEKEETE